MDHPVTQVLFKSLKQRDYQLYMDMLECTSPHDDHVDRLLHEHKGAHTLINHLTDFDALMGLLDGQVEFFNSGDERHA